MYKITLAVFSILLFAFNGYCADNKSKSDVENNKAETEAKAPDMSFNDDYFVGLKAFDDGYTLPESILWREKAAFSDAVGHSMFDDLKEYAHEVYKDKDWKTMCLEYPEEGRPFTEESLLYRMIFEKYYPGESSMIPGFWMPNSSWEGCNVSDPSARVLSNYGASGI